MHQLDLRFAALRIQCAEKRGRLVASLALHGQQTSVLVVALEEVYVLIDGYARVEALRHLGHDVVDALILELPVADALIMAHRLGNQPRSSALEQAWLMVELVEGHGLSHRAVGARLQRSASWVCRRLALVRSLPQSVQAAVREGTVPPQAAMKYLAVLARANTRDCETLVAALEGAPVSVRQVQRLYVAWRRGDAEMRKRVIEQPLLFLRAEQAAKRPKIPQRDPARPLIDDLDGIAKLVKQARRRVREGLLDELDFTRRALIARSTADARTAFDTLTKQVDERCSTSTPAPPS